MSGKTFLFLWLWAVGSLAQSAGEADTLRIRRFLFVGNDKTREEILRREMKLREGDRFDADRLEADRQAIQNLHLFTRVEAHPLPADDAVDVLIIVSEQWFLFPYLILTTNERSWDKLSYGAGVSHHNVAGRNIRLNGSFWLGYNPGAKLSYTNPWIRGTRNLFLQASLYSNRISNKNLDLPDFYEQHQGMTLAVGKRWGIHTYLSAETGYRRVETPAGIPAALSNDGVDRLAHVGLKWVYDRRDLHADPRNGWFLSVQAADYNFAQFRKYGADLRRYQPLAGGLSLALRAAANLSAGRLPPYERYFIGYQERLRGHFTEQWEGDQRFVSGIELRFPLLPVRYFDLSDGASPLAAYMNNLPFGLSGGIFWDAGAIWNRLADSRSIAFQHGFGFGLHVHLPYVDLFRLEYAFDQKGRPEWICDLYVWF